MNMSSRGSHWLAYSFFFLLNPPPESVLRVFWQGNSILSCLHSTLVFTGEGHLVNSEHFHIVFSSSWGAPTFVAGPPRFSADLASCLSVTNSLSLYWHEFCRARLAPSLGPLWRPPSHGWERLVLLKWRWACTQARGTGVGQVTV